MFVAPPTISKNKFLKKPHWSFKKITTLKKVKIGATIKAFLTSTPVKLNEKPLATWKLLLPIAVLVTISLLTFFVKETLKPPTPDEIAAAKQQEAKEQADSLSKTVGEQTEVPTDETPNVATITDVNALQDQPFFKLAQNGDKLLIYEKKKIIVLYRPREDKVIASAPVLYNEPPPAVAGTSSASLESSGAAEIQITQ